MKVKYKAQPDLTKVQVLILSLYVVGCGSNQGVHSCNPCDVGEGSSVRGVFLYKDGTFTNPANPTEWATGLANGNIVMVPLTRGTFDGGTPKIGLGFGDATQALTGVDYKLTYTDPNYAINNDFYDKLQNDTTWNFGWRSETQLHLTGVHVFFFAKDPHTTNVTDKIYWDVDVTWQSLHKPKLYTAPAGIFVCQANG